MYKSFDCFSHKFYSNYGIHSKIKIDIFNKIIISVKKNGFYLKTFTYL